MEFDCLFVLCEELEFKWQAYRSRITCFKNKLLSQCRPASNPGYSLAYADDYKIAVYDQVRLVLCSS
jgi:hypothetical protein